MSDGARGDLVVPSQAGQDGQARGIGAGPATWPERVRIQVVDGSRTGLPRSVHAAGGKELKEPTAGPVHDQDVAVAGSLYARLGGDGIGPASDSAGQVNFTVCVAALRPTTL